MNTRLIIGILILVGLFMFAAGCEITPAQDNPPDNTAPITNEPSTPKPVEPAPAVVSLSSEIRNILAKSEDISSYQYVYQTTETAKYTANHYVNGNKMKIHYGSIQRYDDFMYFDIYLDKEKGLAYLVCEDIADCKGKRGKEVMFDEFNVETPLEALEYLDNGEKVEDSEWDSKKAIVVRYVNNDGLSEKVWLWTYRGMPLKREISKAGAQVVITYNSMVINPLDETSVELPAGLEMM